MSWYSASAEVGDANGPQCCFCPCLNVTDGGCGFAFLDPRSSNSNNIGRLSGKTKVPRMQFYSRSNSKHLAFVSCMPMRIACSLFHYQHETHTIQRNMALVWHDLIVAATATHRYVTSATSSELVVGPVDPCLVCRKLTCYSSRWKWQRNQTQKKCSELIATNENHGTQFYSPNMSATWTINRSQYQAFCVIIVQCFEDSPLNQSNLGR